MSRINLSLRSISFSGLIFLSLFFGRMFVDAAADDSQRGLFYYVVDKSGSITTYGLTEPISSAITEHVGRLPEETEVRLVFFSRQATEPRRWPRMTPEAKTDFADYFVRNFIPEGPTRLYDTVGEVMEEVRAAQEDYSFVTVLIFSDGENNWSRVARSWGDLEEDYRNMVSRHPNSFVYWITLEFDPEEEPPEWVIHKPQPPGTTEIPVPDPPPTADFAAHPLQLKAGEPVEFEYVPQGGRVEELLWDFGDGNAGTGVNPVHHYSSEGRYTVTLRAVGPGGEAIETKSELIHVAPVVPLVARFRMSPDRVRVGEVLQLQDTSEGNPDEREWTIDGEAFSSEASPSLQVEKVGEIEISLTVRRGDEVDAASLLVNVIPPPPNAGFAMQPEEASFGETVVFAADETDESLRHRWTIDGEISLEGPQVEWEGDRHGLLHVVHTVEGPGGLSRHADRIFVHPPVEILPSTGFSVAPRVFFQGESVVFSASETTEEWVHEWLVDGEVVADGPQIDWTSDRAGNLVISHRIRIPGTDAVFEESDEVLSRVPELVRVMFSASPRSGAFPMTVRFNDESEGQAVAYLWDFGDGSLSTERNPVHTYERAGSYSVTLSVTNPEGKITSNFDPVVLSVSPPMPFWQKALLGAAALLVLWVFFVVPFILGPVLAPEKGPKLVGIKTYPLHIRTRKSWRRFLWPETTITIGSSIGSDIRLPSTNGKRTNFALIERSPAASSYSIRPVKDGEIFKIEKQTSLLNHEQEAKSKVTAGRTLRDGDTYEIAGERLTWRQPQKSRSKKAPAINPSLTKTSTIKVRSSRERT